MSTSPAAGCGMGRVWRVSTSGGPKRSIAAALIVPRRVRGCDAVLGLVIVVPFPIIEGRDRVAPIWMLAPGLRRKVGLPGLTFSFSRQRHPGAPAHYERTAPMRDHEH